jgi:hypothetical protein
VNEHVLIVLELEVSVIIAEKISSAFLSLVNVSEIMKIKSLFCQGDPINSYFTLRIQGGEYSTILS